MPTKRQIQKIEGQVRDRSKVILDFVEWLDSERNGCLEWEGKRAVKPKSNQQVKMVFGLMILQTIAQCNDKNIGVSDLLVFLIDGRIPKGQAITRDFLHELMYCICPTVDEEGRRVTLSKMSTVQAANLFERFRTIVAPLGIVIDDPNPDWRNA